MAVKRGYNDCLSTIKPVRDFLDVMSGKWKFPILVSIGVGNDRFVDIQESIPGITPKVLAKELKELEQHQLIKKNCARRLSSKNSIHARALCGYINTNHLCNERLGN
jgi:DNA-binding HxlR family transcriptional regulator